MDSSDRAIARAQYVKAKRTEVRLEFALMADAEIARLLPQWQAEFDRQAEVAAPEVYDFAARARKLLDAGS